MATTHSLTDDDRARLNEIAGEIEHLPAEFRRHFDQDGRDVRFLRKLAEGSGAPLPEGEKRRCPDDGACHHECRPGECWRVHNACPLTDYGETWPPEVVHASATRSLPLPEAPRCGGKATNPAFFGSNSEDELATEDGFCRGPDCEPVEQSHTEEGR